jgi:hypothetical protein
MPRWTLSLPFLVPLLVAITIGTFASPDAPAAKPSIPFTLKWLVYDESDLTAFALRGANFADGRFPGRTDEPEFRSPDDFARSLRADGATRSERFYFEYPLPTLFYFHLPYAFEGPPRLPSAVGDAHQYGVGQHIPRNVDERRAFRPLRIATGVYVTCSLFALWALAAILTRGDRPGTGVGGPNPVWLLALPGAVYFALNRFDIVPTLATALAFFCLGRDRRAWAGAWLGMGVLLKIYPVLFVPIVLRSLGVRGGMSFISGFAAVVIGGFGAAAVSTDWTSLTGPFRVQFGRPLEEGWTLYGKLLPVWLGETGWARFAILGVVTGLLTLRKPSDRDDILARCGIVLVAFNLLAVFWSPQWLLWFLPLVVPLARSDRRILSVAVAVDLINYVSFPLIFIIWRETWPEAVTRPLELTFTLARGVTWLTLAWCLATRRPSSGRLPDCERLARNVLDAGRDSGVPRGLTWASCEPSGPPLNHAGRCLIPFIVTFEPVPGSDMEDLPAARIPRPVTGVFRYANGQWVLDRAPVFNLAPEQVRDRLT